MSKASDVKFWDNTSKKYSLKPVPSEEIYQQKLEITRGYLNANSEVLEFGCGTGTTALKHSPDAKSIVAYDFSPAMIEIANAKKAKQPGADNVQFKVAAVEDIHFGNNKYDVILGHSILHLTFDNENTLRKILRGLKPGGVFISGSGCVKDMNLLIRVAIPVAHFFGKAPAINSFTADELVALHEQVGFEIAKRWDYKAGEIYLVARKPL